MMKILKRNQLIILVISLMLVTAGYLNFTSTNTKSPNTGTIAELGDATLVSSNKIESEEIVENGKEDYQNNELNSRNKYVRYIFCNFKVRKRKYIFTNVRNISRNI